MTGKISSLLVGLRFGEKKTLSVGSCVLFSPYYGTDVCPILIIQNQLVYQIFISIYRVKRCIILPEIYVKSNAKHDYQAGASKNG